MAELLFPSFIRCPVCGASLLHEGASLVCEGGRRHTYDIAKEGYVNLLPPGRAKNARTGDDAEMIRAREKFLSGGGYDRYSREAAEFAAGFLNPVEGMPLVLLDAGAGDGRHTANMANTFSRVLGMPVEFAGFDASKHGVRVAAKRYVKNREMVSDSVTPSYFAANIFELPVCDGCVDIFTSLFAPLPDDEARRVLRQGGLLVICAAGPEHLVEMRRIMYDTPILSGGGAAVPDGFETVGERMIEYKIMLSSNEEIMSLFTMTPFFYNAPAEGRERLSNTESLEVSVQVKCTVAVKK